MAYSSGGLIQATDYNGFVASVNAIWGTGTGDSGYGQSTTLATIAATNTVTATQWSTLITRLNSLNRHQTGSATTLTSPSTGNIITYLSSLTSTISTLTTNRLTYNAQGTTTATTVSNTSTWATSAIKEVSYTFANAAAMRYFFNCGGTFTFSGKDSVLTGNTKSTDWDTLLASVGDITVKAQVSARTPGTPAGTPSVDNTNLGFYDLTTTYQKIVEQFSTTATGGYNLNYATFEAKLNASPGSATILYLKMTLTDASPDETLPANSNYVLGNVVLTSTIAYPEVTYLSNVWGAASTATVTNTQL